MQLIDILARDRVAADVRVSGKSGCWSLANLLAVDSGPGIERAIFEALIAREHLGSTGLGQGVAIPMVASADIQPTAAFHPAEEPHRFRCAGRRAGRPGPGAGGSRNISPTST